MTDDKTPKLFAHLSLAHKRANLPEYEQGGHCPTCGAPLHDGFGLAGGGYGVYSYCDEHGIVSKTEVPE
jgi:hypothetical protein